MALVDYASSSSDDDDDDDDDDHIVAEKDGTSGVDMPHPPLNLSVLSPPIDSTKNFSAPSIPLPDASLLLNSPQMSSSIYEGSDHSSRVAIATAENASRKRESNVLASFLPRNKYQRGTLSNPKNIPDTNSGLLVPPQLTGRSNIVTEDIGKLFVRKQTAPSTE